jgi:hypothetical protein
MKAIGAAKPLPMKYAPTMIATTMIASGPDRFDSNGAKVNLQE